MKYLDACENGDWHLHVWPPAAPWQGKRVPFKCRSWRHAGPCRRWKGAQDFVRVCDALQSSSTWTYLVLTFAQRDWQDTWTQYRAGVKLWGMLQKRLARKFGKFRYVQTWERFRKGGCHCNVVLDSPNVFAMVAGDRERFRKHYLAKQARECGFGRECWSETLDGNSGAMAGYLTKLSRELTGGGKDYQIPVDAPRHFRRIRASRHTLPPVHKSTWTGRLIFAPVEKFLKSHKITVHPSLPAVSPECPLVLQPA